MLEKTITIRIGSRMFKRMEAVLEYDIDRDNLYSYDKAKFIRAAISRQIALEEGKRLLLQRSLK